MRNVPAGMNICGIPSVDETRWFTGSSVWVGKTVEMIVCGVDVELTVGGMLVGNGVAVDSITGTRVAVQAERRREARTMKFFIEANYMSLRGEAKRQQIHLLLKVVPSSLRLSLPLRPRDRSTLSLRSARAKRYGAAPTKFSAYNASS